MIQAAKQEKSTPETVKELKALQEQGRLHAVAVVEFAKDPDTSLHQHFEWDETEAAHQYRLEQARHLIRIQVVIHPKDNKPIRAFVHLEKDRDDGGGYRDMQVVLKNRKLRDQLLEQALREFHSWRARYERLKTLEPIFTAAARVEESLDNGTTATQRRSKKKVT